MKRLVVVGLLLIALAVVLSGALPLVRPAVAEAATPQTFRVLVGAENPAVGVGLDAYFPATLRIHVGDTVRWVQNAHDIHTVTFLAGAPMPDLVVSAPSNPFNSPLMLNPQVAFPSEPAGGQYDGTTYANSGVMSLDPGLPKSFSLTFTKKGTFDYVCVVHGMMMSGKIMVVDDSEQVATPGQVAGRANAEIGRMLAQGIAMIPRINAMVPAATVNSDGTVTHHVLAGYMSGPIDFMRFFPKRLNVQPGDTVEWKLGSAPHTITFRNGGPDIPPADFVPPDQGGPMLVLDPVMLSPHNTDRPLTRTGLYSSGFLPQPGATFSLKIGDIRGQEAYECLLHDTSGMEGFLNVLPRSTH